MLKKLVLFGAVSAILFSLAAQTAKKSGGKGPGILHPDWKAEKGTFEKPMGSLGEKPSEPWTSTTVGAVIAGRQPNPGKVTTMTGEILDFSCYLQIGKHGEKHRSCGQKCLTAGQPIGLLTSDGSMYMLMEEEHDPRRDGLTDFRKVAVEHTGHIMEVTGTLSEHGGYKALYVHGYLKK